MRNTSSISKTRRALLLGAGAVSLPFPGIVRAATDEVLIGCVPADITSYAGKFAEAAGVYPKYGINSRVVTIEGGSRGMQVLLSGKIQAAQGGFSIIVNANREGADLRMVSGSANTMMFQIFGSPGIKGPADLKGQKFAISAFTSETDIAASLALRQWKMTRKDVTVTALGGASQRMAAQLSGQAAVSAYVAPATATAREKGLVELLDLSKDGEPWVFNGIVFQRDFIKSKPDVIKRFLKGTAEGVYKALADEKWAKEVIAKDFKTDSRAVLDSAYDAFRRSYPRDFALSPAAVNNVIREVHEIGPELKTRDPQQYVDYSIVEGLKKEGFFDQMKKQYNVA